MDTSETYIEMCREAKEIQKKSKNYEWGDYIYLNMGEINSRVTIASSSWRDLGELETWWLPRQDQLQEMMIGHDVNQLLWDFICFVKHPIGNGCFDGDNEYVVQFTTFEQLWLAFVMKERWNKIWNGTKWQPSKT